MHRRLILRLRLLARALGTLLLKRAVLLDAGALAGGTSVVWGLWLIYPPLAPIAGGGALLYSCVWAARRWDSSQR